MVGIFLAILSCLYSLSEAIGKQAGAHCNEILLRQKIVGERYRVVDAFHLMHDMTPSYVT